MVDRMETKVSLYTVLVYEYVTCVCVLRKGVFGSSSDITNHQICDKGQGTSTHKKLQHPKSRKVCLQRLRVTYFAPARRGPFLEDIFHGPRVRAATPNRFILGRTSMPGRLRAVALWGACSPYGCSHMSRKPKAFCYFCSHVSRTCKVF